jgi:hypothetical protein
MAAFDEKTDIALGIALPFGPGQSNFKLNYTTLEQAKTDIVNLLLTHKGERYMQPDFGTNLRKFLFQPNTNALGTQLRNEITSAIKFWLPFVKLENIEVDRSVENIDQYKVNVALTFSVTDDISNFTSVTFKFGSDGTVAVMNI